jgi:hypothetical protein
MGRTRVLFVLLLAILIVGIAACSNKSDETTHPESTVGTSPTTQSEQPNSPADSTSSPTSSVDPTRTPSEPTATPTAPTETPTTPPPAGIAIGERPPGFSPENLPLRKLTFSISTPPNTPDDETIYLAIIDLTGGTDQHVEMKNSGEGQYETTVEVQSGAMIRYTYDRHDGTNCCDSNLTREGIGELFEMQYRFLLIEDDVEVVRDTIATWADLRTSHAEGMIGGLVKNAETGEPVLDADVSISGIHVASRVDGSFKVEGLPMGEHFVVVHSDSGDFLPVQRVVVLDSPEPNSESVELTVTPTKLVPVTFDVLLPDTTPDGAWVKLAGNIRSLGARIAHPARPLTPDNFFIPRISREEPNGNTASAEFMLPEGAFIEYFYTIGPIGVVGDRAEQGRWVYRSFIVGKGGDQRSDRVKFWAIEGWPLISLKLTPPAGTPLNTQIALTMGPSSWMEPEPGGTYSTVIGSNPPGSTISYRYVLGDDPDGADASPGAPEINDGTRTIVAPEKYSVVTDTITRWTGQLDTAKRQDNGALAVKFRVSVPPETPADASIFLLGSRPALGIGIEMTPLATNPWIYEADVVFGHDGSLAYHYELRSEGALESSTREIDTNFDGQIVNDWVAAWPGLSPQVASRDDFIQGYYTPDLFSPSYIATSKPTYERIADHEGTAVAISSVWSYGQSQPIPTLEYRAVLADSVATPLEDALEQTRIAREAGLEVFFSPQFNMEQALGGFEVYNGSKSDEWWAAWLKLADELWTWQATVAEMIEAEYMVLPGPLFHVYDQIDKPPDDPFFIPFESEHARLIAKMRRIYSGKIIISGGDTRYDFPGLADYNSETTYGVGVPQLPADTTVAEFIDYYEPRFVARVDRIFEKWGNPVFLSTVHAPAVPTENDPSGEIAQANAIEAIFQVIATRPFINGSLSWSYTMIDAPLIPSDGLRGRLGEAVLAKWYAILGG